MIMSYDISCSDLLQVSRTKREEQIKDYGMTSSKVKIKRLYKKVMIFFLTNKYFNGVCTGIGAVLFIKKLILGGWF